MKTLKNFEVLIPSDIDIVYSTVGDVLQYIQETLGQVEEIDAFEIRLILNELILNAIRHGNKQDFHKKVKVTVGIAKGIYIFICIEDEGEGYDHTCLMQRHKSLQELSDICDMKETGRGILIVKSLCNSLRFNRKGNKVIVLKQLSRV